MLLACWVRVSWPSHSPPPTPVLPSALYTWTLTFTYLLDGFSSLRIEDMRKRHVEVSQPPLPPTPGE